MVVELKNGNADTFDEIITMIKKLEIKTKLVKIDKSGFSRTIEFFVFDTRYRIKWYNNLCSLLIGDGDDNKKPFFKFTKMYLDTTWPTVGGNRCLGFCNDLNRSLDAFRIPIK